MSQAACRSWLRSEKRAKSTSTIKLTWVISTRPRPIPSMPHPLPARPVLLAVAPTISRSAFQELLLLHNDRGGYGTPAFWNNTIYTAGAADTLRAYQLSSTNVGTFNTSGSSSYYPEHFSLAGCFARNLLERHSNINRHPLGGADGGLCTRQPCGTGRIHCRTQQLRCDTVSLHQWFNWSHRSEIRSAHGGERQSLCSWTRN